MFDWMIFKNAANYSELPFVKHLDPMKSSEDGLDLLCDGLKQNQIEKCWILKETVA